METYRSMCDTSFLVSLPLGSVTIVESVCIWYTVNSSFTKTRLGTISPA